MTAGWMIGLLGYESTEPGLKCELSLESIGTKGNWQESKMKVGDGQNTRGPRPRPRDGSPPTPAI